MATTHGMHGTSLYGLWKRIRARCHNPNTNRYHRYGGRGIKLCREWRQSFEAFYAYVSVLPNCEKDGYTLDRIDNDGDYEPGNVQWATATAQSRNRHSNHMIEFMGKTQCMQAWANDTGLRAGTIEWRIRHGWTAERALTTPPQVQNKKRI